MRKKSWGDLSNPQRGWVVIGAVVQVGLQLVALRDLRHRRPEELNGPGWAWACATFVNTVGPLAYFVFGRRRPNLLPLD
ncbi:PLDc N-terminal domain-containing protein [Terrabacter sp. MAHUQ-38]|uniref:PLDc N-terminal domain-containing protein n=1 Tax=unclassified Terrabacter TaxID=2630222 RepID=UPI00165E18B9|nr:PLDc N-terminal domain-containing protein [Terrabacter sp. MAHUQ-38]MBC9821190.1 PLDc N-terminal domain-containing protein [Terrabacter sp. MAHUQ-38]